MWNAQTSDVCDEKYIHNDVLASVYMYSMKQLIDCCCCRPSSIIAVASNLFARIDTEIPNTAPRWLCSNAVD
jgi:hypothetical protein